MRCLIRYQLRGEDVVGRHQFCSDAPDLEQVILHLSRFLHPEVIYEFPPLSGDQRDSIQYLRQRMAHARHFLQQYCNLHSLSYLVLPEDADLAREAAKGQWTTVLMSEDSSDA